MPITDYLKEDKILIPEITVNRRLIPKDIQKQFNALKALDLASTEQTKLGLGIPRADLLPEIEKMRKEVYAYNKSRVLKSGYKMVEEPPVKYFPRFQKGNTTFLNKKPLLAMVKLEKGLSSIRVSVKGQDYTAPLPRFPKAAIDNVKKVKAEAPDAEFHLLYMPSWSKEPQRDPVLLAKIKSKYFYVYGWDNDKAIIDEILLKK